MEADAEAKVREAIHLLELALPGFQTGGEGHKSTLEALTKLSKVFPPDKEVPGIQETALIALAQKAKQSAMMRAAMQQQAAMGGGGLGGPGGPSTPAAPPMAV